jgi:hypothetical protein
MIIHEFTEEQQTLWNEWIATRPACVRNMCEKLPANRLYLLKTTGQKVTIYSYSENETVTVDVMEEYNPGVLLERRVFGINPDDLEECDL